MKVSSWILVENAFCSVVLYQQGACQERDQPRLWREFLFLSIPCVDCREMLHRIHRHGGCFRMEQVLHAMCTMEHLFFGGVPASFQADAGVLAHLVSG